MRDIYIVLYEPKFSGNVGAVARAMANFGFEKLILVNPKCKIDDEAKNRAKHAQKILKRAKILKDDKYLFKKMDAIIATTGIVGTDYNLIRSPLPVYDSSKKIVEVKGDVAIIFGPEDDGLNNEFLKKCDFTVTIPTDKKYPILNLSHSVSIFLYELFRQFGEEQIRKQHKLISPREKLELLKVIDELIENTKFRTEDEKTTQKMIWKKYVGKAMFTKREAFGMIGFLKKLK